MDKETYDNNKSIAIFMGWEETDSEVYRGYLCPPKDSTFVMPTDPVHMKFHSSYNWLMPVFYKLQKVKVATSDKLRWGKLMGNVVRKLVDEQDINKVYIPIVKAIEWYQKNYSK